MTTLALTVPILLQLTVTAPQPAAEQLQKGLVKILEQQTEAVPGWPWKEGGVNPSANLGGVIAVALLGFYEQSLDPATWITLTQYAHSLRQAYRPEARFPYKADIEFLARVAKAGIDKEGSAFARELFERVRRRSPAGADEYARIAKGRAGNPDVIGYDIALTIRAALAVGDRGYAIEVADAALAAGELRVVTTKNANRITSLGALVHAVAQLHRRGDRSSLVAAAETLLLHQAAHGSWAMNNTQATAYAVLGLSAVRDVRGARAAALEGQAWLAERQLRSGAWAEYHDGLPEPFVGQVIPLIHAEAFAALLAQA